MLSFSESGRRMQCTLVFIHSYSFSQNCFKSSPDTFGLCESVLLKIEPEARALNAKYKENDCTVIYIPQHAMLEQSCDKLIYFNQVQPDFAKQQKVIIGKKKKKKNKKRKLTKNAHKFGCIKLHAFTGIHLIRNTSSKIVKKKLLYQWARKKKNKRKRQRISSSSSICSNKELKQIIQQLILNFT